MAPKTVVFTPKITGLIALISGKIIRLRHNSLFFTKL
jgi:hypothetical protein